jgi:hypothetical protein
VNWHVRSAGDLTGIEAVLDGLVEVDVSGHDGHRHEIELG